mgnify:CR=1 FL=1
MTLEKYSATRSVCESRVELSKSALRAACTLVRERWSGDVQLRNYSNFIQSAISIQRVGKVLSLPTLNFSS